MKHYDKLFSPVFKYNIPHVIYTNIIIYMYIAQAMLAANLIHVHLRTIIFFYFKVYQYEKHIKNNIFMPSA